MFAFGKSPVAAFETAMFFIESQRCGDELFDFKLSSVTGYNKDNFTRWILPTEEESIKFTGKATEPGYNAVLRFQIGIRPILMTASEVFVMIGLSHWLSDDEWIDYDKCLNYQEAPGRT